MKDDELRQTVKEVSRSNTVIFGISMPRELYKRLEKRRGLVSRSRYFQYLVEREFEEDFSKEDSAKNSLGGFK